MLMVSLSCSAAGFSSSLAICPSILSSLPWELTISVKGFVHAFAGVRVAVAAAVGQRLLSS